MAKIVVQHLTKLFGTRPARALPYLDQGLSKEELQARHGVTIGVHDVSLDIHAGEIFVLMGLSGSGKSTLVRLLNRLHEPTRGSILIDGLDITRLGKRELMRVRRTKFSGMVFQQFAILPHRTVVGNAEFGLEVHGVPKRVRQKRAQEIIDLVGLKGWEHSYPHELSGGMQQRVGLARALAVNADILLMDEAFSALDPLIRREMQDELLALQRRLRKTIVFVTHDLDEALRLGDRIAIMKNGQVVQLGSAEEIILSPVDSYVKAFTQGIDRTEVLTARTIMQPALATLDVDDSYDVAVTKMQHHDLEGMFVLDASRKLSGYLSLDDLIRMRRQVDPPSPGDVRKSSVSTEHITEQIPEHINVRLLREAPVVRLATPLAGVIDLAATRGTPIAVLDESGDLAGVINKRGIIRALAHHVKVQPRQEKVGT
jgi:glycine betaine/proline transport system ATP-binding protein